MTRSLQGLRPWASCSSSNVEPLAPTHGPEPAQVLNKCHRLRLPRQRLPARLYAVLLFSLGAVSCGTFCIFMQTLLNIGISSRSFFCAPRRFPVSWLVRFRACPSHYSHFLPPCVRRSPRTVPSDEPSGSRLVHVGYQVFVRARSRHLFSSSAWRRHPVLVVAVFELVFRHFREVGFCSILKLCMHQ